MRHGSLNRLPRRFKKERNNEKVNGYKRLGLRYGEASCKLRQTWSKETMQCLCLLWARLTSTNPIHYMGGSEGENMGRKKSDDPWRHFTEDKESKFSVLDGTDDSSSLPFAHIGSLASIFFPEISIEALAECMQKSIPLDLRLESLFFSRRVVGVWENMRQLASLTYQSQSYSDCTSHKKWRTGSSYPRPNTGVCPSSWSSILVVVVVHTEKGVSHTVWRAGIYFSRELNGRHILADGREIVSLHESQA